MTDTEINKRDRLAYLALYYAIHGDQERSEKIRLAMRRPFPEEKNNSRIGFAAHACVTL